MHTRSGEELYVVRKNGHYYRPMSKGYTSVLSEAGYYTLREAQAAIQGIDGATYRALSKELEVDLLPRIYSAGIAGCTCMTKTPDISYHSTACRYRVLEESAQIIQRLRGEQYHVL